MTGPSALPSNADYIGRRARSLDWEARTLGAACYVGDMVPTDALHGAILRSPYPYAKVEGIDTSQAEAMPCVRAIITAADFPPGVRYVAYGSMDRPPLADDVVRFIGQEVAAVAADTLDQARAAIAKIKVRYRKLRAPLNVKDALMPGSLELHSPLPDAPPRTKNVRFAFRRLWGDIEVGRSGANHSVSGRFHFPQQTQCCMETHRALAQWSEEGKLHMWSPTGTPLYLKGMLQACFYLEPTMVVVHEVAVGGSFGSKLAINGHEALAAALARKSKRPVLITLTREEEFETGYTRHAFDVDLTLRADDEGRLRTFEGTALVDNGAYLHSGVSVVASSIGAFGSAYTVDGVDIAAQLVDTCKVPGGSMRGYGGPQSTFPRESLIDEMAEHLGRDPVDLRIQNAYGSNTESLVGHIGTNGTADCLVKVREAIDWDREKADQRRGKGRGVGVAIGEHCSGPHTFPGSNQCDGVIDLHRDGSLCVRHGGADVGTGQNTILAQLAGHELGVPLDRVRVLSMDTDKVPLDWGGYGSRGTHYTGHAIGLTARKFAERIRRLAAERLGDGDIRLEGGVAKLGDKQIALGDLVAMSNESIDGVLSHAETFIDPNVEIFNDDTGRSNYTATHNYAAHAALVDVDAKTGKLRILDYVSASDSGTVLNPLMMEGQVRGAVFMGMGGALGEELIFEKGKVVNPAFLHYAIPRSADVPDIRVIHAGMPDEKGPYGAKGAGELGVNAVGAAVANAVYDAIGVRIRSLPITPDKILNALAKKQGRRRNFHLWRRPGRWYIELVRVIYPYGLSQLLHWWQTCKHAELVPPPRPITDVVLPADVAGMIAALAPDAAIMGGGTDLQLQRRQNIRTPDRLVSVADVTELKQISIADQGDMVIGAAVTLHELGMALRDQIPAVAEAIDSIASPQVRNVATVAGNLVQAKRCWFFRNGFNCYKRRGHDAPCYSLLGDHRFYHAAIDGHRCQAVTPSDLATVLVALDAAVTIEGPTGARAIAVEKLYKGPGETVLKDREVITAITIPAHAFQRASSFKKLNLWQGDFAVVSAALSVSMDEAQRCTDVRLCLGAVGPVPLRMRATERKLIGKRLDVGMLRALLDEELDKRGHPLARNAWKLDAVAGLTEHAAEEIISAS